MKITRAAWNEYAVKLSRIDKQAGSMMTQYIQRVGIDDTQRLIDYAIALVNKYGAASSALAAQMYDEIAELAGMTLPAAEPAAVAASGDVAAAIMGNRTSEALMQSVVSRFVKQAGADTTLKNARRDGAQFAWIPNGDSCAFCIVLASRGWQYASKAVLNGDHAEHIHANCDCNFMIRFDSATSVEGYDPDAYLEQYESAEGSTPEEKLRSMRRAARRSTGGEKNDIIRASKNRRTVRLSKAEYAKVMSEIATNLTDVQRNSRIFQKCIGDYVYFVENNGVLDFRIIGKGKIKPRY